MATKGINHTSHTPSMFPRLVPFTQIKEAWVEDIPFPKLPRKAYPHLTPKKRNISVHFTEWASANFQTSFSRRSFDNEHPPETLSVQIKAQNIHLCSSLLLYNNKMERLTMTSQMKADEQDPSEKLKTPLYKLLITAAFGPLPIYIIGVLPLPNNILERKPLKPQYPSHFWVWLPIPYKHPIACFLGEEMTTYHNDSAILMGLPTYKA